MEKGLDDIFNEALNETTDASPAPEAPSGRPASGGTGPTRPDATINTNIPLRADATAAQIQERINVLEKKFIDGKKRVAEIKEIALSGKAPSMALTLANEQQSLDVTLANLPAQIEALKKKYAQRLASETPTTPTPEPAPSPLEPPTPDSANIKKEALEQKIAVIDKRIDTALKKIEAVTAQGVERSKRLDDATSKLDAFNELLARVQSRRAELEKPPTPALPAEILAIPEAMRPITMRDGSTLEINRVKTILADKLGVGLYDITDETFTQPGLGGRIKDFTIDTLPLSIQEVGGLPMLVLVGGSPRVYPLTPEGLARLKKDSTEDEAHISHIDSLLKSFNLPPELAPEGYGIELGTDSANKPTTLVSINFTGGDVMRVDPINNTILFHHNNKNSTTDTTPKDFTQDIVKKELGI